MMQEQAKMTVRPLCGQDLIKEFLLSFFTEEALKLFSLFKIDKEILLF